MLNVNFISSYKAKNVRIRNTSCIDRYGYRYVCFVVLFDTGSLYGLKAPVPVVMYRKLQFKILKFRLFDAARTFACI
jgi:hypothetical protein